MFVLTSESDKTRINTEYFSLSFLATLKASLFNLPSMDHAVFVVFSKADVARSHEIDLDTLRAANTKSLENIQNIFAPNIAYHVVSSKTGSGLRPLIEQLAHCAVDMDGLPKGIDR
jgi:hypothetical protein